MDQQKQKSHIGCQHNAHVLLGGFLNIAITSMHFLACTFLVVFFTANRKRTNNNGPFLASVDPGNPELQRHSNIMDCHNAG